MDILLMEQHLRSPIRLFPDPMMAAQFMPQDADSAALLEKARQHLQMWGRSPYAEMLLPQMYAQRPNINAAALNLGLWQGQWPPQLSAAAGFLNNQAALQQAAAAAQQQQQARSPPPPPQALTPNSSGSPSPSAASDSHMRNKHFAPRFSPYQVPPSHTQTHASPSPLSPPMARNSPSN
jgi:T-box protein 20